jgi:hypothetical protein
MTSRLYPRVAEPPSPGTSTASSEAYPITPPEQIINPTSRPATSHHRSRSKSPQPPHSTFSDIHNTHHSEKQPAELSKDLKNRKPGGYRTMVPRRSRTQKLLLYALVVVLLYFGVIRPLTRTKDLGEISIPSMPKMPSLPNTNKKSSAEKVNKVRDPIDIPKAQKPMQVKIPNDGRVALPREVYSARPHNMVDGMLRVDPDSRIHPIYQLIK